MRDDKRATSDLTGLQVRATTEALATSLRAHRWKGVGMACTGQDECHDR